MTSGSRNQDLGFFTATHINIQAAEGDNQGQGYHQRKVDDGARESPNAILHAHQIKIVG